MIRRTGVIHLKINTSNNHCNYSCNNNLAGNAGNRTGNIKPLDISIGLKKHVSRKRKARRYSQYNRTRKRYLLDKSSFEREFPPCKRK